MRSTVSDQESQSTLDAVHKLTPSQLANTADTRVVQTLSRIGQCFTLFCVRVGLFVMFVCILDLFAAIGLWITGALPPDTEATSADSRRLADGYHNAPWTSAYYQELGTMRMQWHPYSYWLGLPHSGRSFNIGPDGLRITWRGRNPTSRCTKPTRIFMFGGSTTFGDGARDDYTVPSWLQKILDDTPYCTEVTNFGQEGYVSSQELLLLLEQLRVKNTPDLVVFYDGINDSETAWLEGRAGVTWDETVRKNEFNITNRYYRENRDRLYQTAFYIFAMDSSLGRTAKLILKALSPKGFRLMKGKLIGSGLASEDGSTADIKLAADVIRNYLANRAIVEALARKFGYQELFYWQPTLFDKPHLTPYERAMLRANADTFRPIIETVYTQMERIATQNGIMDISGIFHDATQPYYVDTFHLNEDGNRVIAQRMSRDVLRFLAERSIWHKASPSAG